MDYSDLIDTATTLIQEFGTSLTLVKKTNQVFDPATNSMSSGTSSEYTISGVLENININLIDNTNIQRNDMYVLASANVAISEKDAIIINNQKWNIIQVEEIKPSASVIYYRLLVRK